MTTKAEGPYNYQEFREKDEVLRSVDGETSAYGWLFERGDGMWAVNLANEAYAEGFKAGRASRDGLREALMQILGELDYAYESPDDYPLPSLEKYAPIIAADEEEGK